LPKTHKRNLVCISSLVLILILKETARLLPNAFSRGGQQLPFPGGSRAHMTSRESFPPLRPNNFTIQGSFSFSLSGMITAPFHLRGRQSFCSFSPLLRAIWSGPLSAVRATPPTVPLLPNALSSLGSDRDYMLAKLSPVGQRVFLVPLDDFDIGLSS